MTKKQKYEIARNDRLIKYHAKRLEQVTQKQLALLLDLTP